MGKKKKQKTDFHKAKDPNLKRECAHYEKPVPSREYLSAYLKERGRPTSFRRIAQAFSVDDVDEQEGLRRRLIAMVRDGQLMSNRRGSYALVSEMALVRGHVQSHRDGFGFLISDQLESDIFLPSREMRGVFNDDVVLVRVINPGSRRPEGVVVEVLERKTQQLAGRFFKEEGVALVDPDNKTIHQNILIASGQEKGAVSGQFVVVEITAQPTKSRQAMGRVVEILGDHLTPGMEVELAIRSYDLPFRWSQPVTQEAEAFSAEITKQEIDSRLDMRQLPFVTIDGEDAQDFDDAVYCERVNDQGWRLYVAIADVSHYVVPYSHLDQEAERRGNSVYFPAKVIPMLPEVLSNGLCSLKPKVDRLALVCVITLNQEGEVDDYQFQNAVIHSHARLTYTEVALMLRGLKTQKKIQYPQLAPLYALFKKLQCVRQKRGAVEFDSKETKILFNDLGKIDKIVSVERNDAHRVIEEMMLLANICAARFLSTQKLPAIYRVHEGPQEQKLLDLRDFLKNFNLRLTGGKKPHAKDYSNLLKRVRRREDSHLLQTVLLRSLQQAVYSTDNVGHFGLAYDAYTHFTSPIRRYPDLLVHRMIKNSLPASAKKKFPYSLEDMENFSEHCSMTERRADRATRDAVDWLKCEYMQDKVGETFSARIIEVTGFGIFVELNDIYVQGLVHITSLKNDYYRYDDKMRLLRGKRTNQVYKLADSITVLLARVNLDDRIIDFELVDG